MGAVVNSLLNKTSVLWGLYPWGVVPVVGYTKGFKGKGWKRGASIAQSDGGNASDQRRHGGLVPSVADGAAEVFCAGNPASQGSRDDASAVAVKWETWHIAHVSRCKATAGAQKPACGHAAPVPKVGNRAPCAQRTRLGRVYSNGGGSHGLPAQTDAACCLSIQREVAFLFDWESYV
jgi:hypothetical protein